MAANSLVAYYRVSTQRQGASGLGLEAQETAVRAYARQNNAEIKASFTEVESGKNNNRPELARAINLAKVMGATLTVAKLDRLARNVAFVSKLMEADVQFVACDNPHANKLTVHILAAMAEYERDMIAARVKAALAAAKARGVKLGCHDPRCPGKNIGLRPEAGRRGNAAYAAKAAKHREAVRPVAEWMRAQGLSWAAVAAGLNDRGIKTMRGREWTLANIHRLLCSRDEHKGNL